jgi:hypothetical protein
LGGKDKVTTTKITLPEVEKRIAVTPFPESVGDRLLAAIASGKGVASGNLEDGTRYGNKFSTFAEYAGPYVARLRNGTAWIGY